MVTPKELGVGYDGSVLMTNDAAMSKQSPLGSPSGATSTLVTFLYQQSFSYMDMGYGSAAAVILFLIIFSLSTVREILGRRSE